MRKLYDISPVVSERTALFPGDQPFERTLQCQLKNGDSVNLSSIRLSPHTGAHADAPFHYDEKGVTIDSVELEPYLGECVVVTVTGQSLIEPKHWENAVPTRAKRVLFRTLSQPDPNLFPIAFSAFAPESIDALGKRGVILVGIDTPSIDPADSKALPSHRAIFRWGMRNLECLWLNDVPDGTYELIALPLKLGGCDSSPVRAILRTL